MSPTSTRQRVGLALAGLLSAVNIPSAFFPAPDGAWRHTIGCGPATNDRSVSISVSRPAKVRGSS